MSLYKYTAAHTLADDHLVNAATEQQLTIAKDFTDKVLLGGKWLLAMGMLESRFARITVKKPLSGKEAKQKT